MSQLRCGVRLALAVGAAAIVVGCVGEMPTQPDAPAFSTPHVLPAPVEPELWLSGSMERDSLPLGLNECEVTNIMRDTDGVVSARLSDRRVARIDNRLADTVAREFLAMQFDARGEQSRKARCVLRDGDEARAFMRTVFTSIAAGGPGAACAG